MSKKRKKSKNKNKNIKIVNETNNNEKEVIENTEVAKVTEEKPETALIVIEKEKMQLAVLPNNREIAKKIAKKISLALIGTISVAYAMLMALIGTSAFYVSHLQNGLIQKGVFINGVNVENLSSEEAINTVNNELNDTIPETITLKYKENTYNLNLKGLEIEFDAEASVERAYSIGRTQNVVKDLWDYAKTINETVNIESSLIYNEDVLNQWMSILAENLPDKVQEYTYEVENDKLIINRGESGIIPNQEELKDIILDNLRERKYDEVIEIPIIETLPKDINIQEIYNNVYTEPKDAYYTEEPMQIFEEVIGVDFDIQSAQSIINSNPEQEQYEIELTLTEPNIFVRDLEVFPDELSTFSTNYVNNPNRTTNLRIAADKISGTVLMPGETFSFNGVVGERTYAQGYRNAAIFVNGQVEDGLAGGICQISSTLYDAVIGANLEIVERHNHSKLTSYLPGGKDATVVWGRYDFQFKNNREYPIKIEMSVEGGKATASIYGILSDEEYDINIESYRAGVNGIYSVYNAYKVYRQDGEEVEREFLSRDLYK